METRPTQKYNQAYTLNFNLYDVDGVDMNIAATFASGDIKIMKDEGAEANTTNLPTDEGQGYSLVLTATEMSAARVVIYIVDQTVTKVWLDIAIAIETYGNASAQHAFDLDTASVAQTADHTAGIADIPTVAEFNARTLVAASYFDPAADAVANVTLVATTTTNTDMVAEAPTSAANADAVWDEALAGHVGAGSYGKAVADIETDATAILADTNELQSDDVPGLIAALNDVAATDIVSAGAITTLAGAVANVDLVDTTTTNTDMVAEAPTVGAIADQVWDETLADHLGAGSTGSALNAAGAAGDPWATAIPGAYGAGTAGLLLGTTIPGNLSDIETDTADIQSRLPAALVGGLMSSDVTAISTDTTAADNLELQYDTTGLTGDTFPATQAQIGNLASGTAAINTVAESFTKTGAEPETNTYTSTHAEDGTYHIVEDDATATDAYYQFDVGANGVPVSVTWIGYAQSAGDSYTLHAYNWVGTSWDQVGSKPGSPGTTPSTETYNLTNAHVGTGANAGKVRFRFLSSDGTAYATDRLLCSYAVVAQTVGYADGAIWVDTNGSNTNTAVYVDGVADNPVSTWAAALTLSASLGLKRFHIINGSSITLSANSDNYTLTGDNWTLALNGQSIVDANFSGASVSGTGTGSGSEFHSCLLSVGATTTTADAFFLDCGLAGSFVCSAAGTYYFDKCFSGVAGTSTPDIDFGAVIGNTNLNIRHYSGGIEIKNMGGSGTDTMSLEGDGQLVINANCSGGVVAIRGHFTVTDNAGGVVTLSDNARIDIDQINEQADTALTDYDGPTNAEMEARTILSASYFDPAADTVANVTEVAQMAGTIGTLDALDTAQDTQHASTQADIAALNDPTAASIADAVWDEAKVGHVGAGSFGEEVQAHATSTELSTHDGKLDTVDTNVDAILVDTSTTIPNQITGLNDLSAAEVNAEVDTALNDYDGPTNAEMTAAFTEIKGATWSSLTDTLEAIRDVEPHGTVMRGTDSAATAANLATVDTNVDAILVDTGTTIPGLIAALENLSAAAVNAEMVDVLQTDTIPDSYAADGAQPTIAQAILMVQQFLTEKAVTGTTVTMKKPDGSTSAATFTLDDGTSPTSITRAS